MNTYNHHRSTDADKQLRKDGGRYIRELRIAAGLSQSQLSEILGLQPYTFVSQIETGRGRIPPYNYERWAEALKTDPEIFVRTLLSYYDPVTHRILFKRMKDAISSFVLLQFSIGAAFFCLLDELNIISNLA